MKENYCYEKLKKLREAHNLSYAQMAKELGLSTSYYWQIENKTKNLYYSLAVKIARYFSLKPDDIFYE